MFSPDLGAAGLPVMVWIYGGAYRSGASSLLGYDGTPLARQNVVVVTFNHRIGVEGYAYLPGVPANRALLDQVAALRWVRENIAAFGGDPDLVTVFGESAGAGAIASLLVMPAAAGLFRRAIAQSVPGTFFSPALAAEVTAAIAEQAGLPATTEAFAAADPARLVAASDAVRPGDHPWGAAAHTGVPFSPVVDGEVLPAAPWQAVAAGAARDVDLITGHNRDEFRLFTELSGLRGKITDEAASRRCAGWRARTARRPTARPTRTRTPRRCSNWSTPTGCSGCRPCTWRRRTPRRAGGRSSTRSATRPRAGLGACHAIDVPLVFGVYPGSGGCCSVRAAGQRDGARGPDALAVGGVRRGRRPRLAAVRAGPPDDPHLRRPARRGPVPGRASMHIWDQHRFGVLDLTPSPRERYSRALAARERSESADLRAGRV